MTSTPTAADKEIIPFVTLTKDQFTTPIERVMERSVSGRISSIVQIRDMELEYAGELQPFYAENVNSPNWPIKIGSNKLRVNAIESGLVLNKFRGTKFAIDHFAMSAGFSYVMTLENQTIISRPKANFEVTSSVFSIADVNWITYLERVLRYLLPTRISIGTIVFSDIFIATEKSVAIGVLRDYESIDVNAR